MPNVQGGIVEYFSPGDHLTLTSGGAITGGNLVMLSANRTVLQATAGALTCIGVALHNAASGDKVTVATDGVWPLVASGAITYGDAVEPAATGATRVLATVDAAGSFNPRAMIGVALESIANLATGRVKLLR